MSEEEEVGTAVIRLRVDRTDADREVDQAADDYSRKGSERAKRDGDKQGKDQGDAFSRALKAKLETAFKSLPNAPDVMIGANTTEAGQKILKIKDELLALKESNIGIDITDAEAALKIKELKAELDILTRDKDIRIRVDANAASVALGALAKEFGSIETVAKKTGKATGDAAKAGMGPLITAAITLGPALIPIAGGLLAASSAAVGFGLAGIIAFKGIQNEILKGTKAGHDYQQLISDFKTSLGGVQQTVAKGILPGLEQSLGKLRTQLPSLNIELGQSAGKLGEVVSHLTGGLVDGLVKFNPLIQQAETYVVNLTAKFEHWASGPGGGHFMQTLSDDLKQIGPLLANLIPAVINLVGAFAPVGSQTVSEITVLSGAIKNIPVGILQAGATAFVLFKTAALGASVFETAAKALRGFAAAETEAAIASGAAGAGAGAAGAGAAARGLSGGIRGIAGSMAAGLSFITPYALAIGGFELGINAAAKATHSWETSNNGLQASLSQVLDAASHFARLDISGGIKAVQNAKNARGQIQDAQAIINLNDPNRVISDVYKAGPAQPGSRGQGGAPSPEDAYKANKDAADKQQQLFKQLKADADGYSHAAQTANYQNTQFNRDAEKYSKLAYDANTKLQALRQKQGQDPLVVAQQASAIALNIQNAEAQRYVATVDHVNAANQSALKYQTDASGSISKSSAAYDSLEKQLQGNIDTENKWNATKKNQTVTIQGQKYSIDAWNAAYAQSNSDVSKAVGLLQGHREALQADKNEMLLLQMQQNNINSAYSQASVDLKLTTDQLDLYSSALGITTTDLATGAISAKQFETIMASVKTTMLDANTANAAWLASIDQFNKSGKTAADTAALMGAAIKAGRGTALDNAGVNLSAASAAEAAGAAMKQYSASIGKNGELLGQLTKTSHGYVIEQPKLTAGSIAIANALTQQATSAQQAAEQVYQNELQTKGQKVATQDFLDVYSGYRQQMIVTAEQSGLNETAATHLTDKYLAIPKNVQTAIKQIGAGTVQGAVGQLTTVLLGLDRDIRIAFGIHDNASAAIDRVAAKMRGLNGTTAYTYIQSVGPQGTSSGSKSGAYGTSTGASGNITDFYAAGGVAAAKYAGGSENHIAQIVPAGTNRLFGEPETGGEAYIPLAPGKRARSMDILGDVAKRFGVSSFGNGGINGSPSSGSSWEQKVDELVAAIEMFLEESSSRPVQLWADKYMLAQTVNDQNNRNGRRT